MLQDGTLYIRPRKKSQKENLHLQLFLGRNNTGVKRTIRVFKEGIVD
jgi:hypothetical protein